MPRQSNAQQQQSDPVTFDMARQTRPDVTRTQETTAGVLAGFVERSGGWLKEQVHQGLQEFVSTVLLGRDHKTPEPQKDHEIDKGIDR
jgi:hypothetical protein